MDSSRRPHGRAVHRSPTSMPSSPSPPPSSSTTSAGSTSSRPTSRPTGSGRASTSRHDLGVYDGDRMVAFAELIDAGRGEAGVLPDYRRRGIGTALARWLEDAAREHGYTAIGGAAPAGLRRRPAAGEARVPRPLDELGARSSPRAPTVPHRELPAGLRDPGRDPRRPRGRLERRRGRLPRVVGPRPRAVRGLPRRDRGAAPATSPGCCGSSPTRRARSSAPRCW